MDSTTYETPDEAREALLIRGVSEDVVDAFLAAARVCAEQLADEYDAAVNVDAVADWMEIGYGELASDYLDAGVWDNEDVKDITVEIRSNPVCNSQLVLGKTARRSRHMMRLSAAAHQMRLGEK